MFTKLSSGCHSESASSKCAAQGLESLWWVPLISVQGSIIRLYKMMAIMANGRVWVSHASDIGRPACGVSPRSKRHTEDWELDNSAGASLKPRA